MIDRVRWAPRAVAVLLAVAALSRSAAAEPPPQVGARRRGHSSRQTTWDLNLDGAFGRAFEDSAHWSGFGRIRGGVLFMDERDLQSPTFTSLGLVYELSDLSPATVGFQGEFMSLSSGTWTQIGAMIDLYQIRPVFMASVGFSVVGAEVQLRGDDTQGAYWAVYGKLRIPVRIIALALSD